MNKETNYTSKNQITLLSYNITMLRFQYQVLHVALKSSFTLSKSNWTLHWFLSVADDSAFIAATTIVKFLLALSFSLRSAK